MREIKFRAWNNSKAVEKMLHWEFIKQIRMDEIFERPNLNVMQYTGLKDKNGKEIYEGDLFGKFGGDKERPGEYEIHGQIKFDTDFAMFVIELTNGGWMELFDYMNNRQNQREIIGNIYENPDLSTSK